jgi:hypothetical protein
LTALTSTESAFKAVTVQAGAAIADIDAGIQFFTALTRTDSALKAVTVQAGAAIAGNGAGIVKLATLISSNHTPTSEAI